MMKYKIDETVTIREFEAMIREGVILNYSIKQYCGRKARIVKVEKYRCKLDIDDGKWYWADDRIAHNFTYGEEIEVSDRGEDCAKRIFVGFNDGATYPYTCVDSDHEDDFKNGREYGTCNWKHARKLNKEIRELTLEEVAKLKGVDVGWIRIKE